MKQVSDAAPDLTDEQRIKAIKAKLFIQHDFVELALKRMKRLANLEEYEERENLIITGDSGAGKSTIAERFRDTFPCLCEPDSDANVVPVVYVSLPARPTLAGLCSEILDVLMEPRKESTPERQLVQSVLKLLRTVGTRVLIIDEMQDMHRARPTEKEVLRNFIKSVGAKCNLSLVLVGMPDLLSVVSASRQLSRRFDILASPPWKYDERGSNLLYHLEPMLLLKHPSNLADDRKMGEWIFDRSEGTLGDTLKILRLAAEHAIKTGEERITMKTLSAIDFTRFTKRSAVGMRETGLVKPGK